MRRIPVCLALLLLTACVKPVTWVGVSALPVALPGHFSVRGDAVWNRLDGGDPDTYDAWWTANGSSLDLLRFHTGIASGQRPKSTEALLPGPHPTSRIVWGAGSAILAVRSTDGVDRSSENCRYR